MRIERVEVCNRRIVLLEKDFLGEKCGIYPNVSIVKREKR